MDGGIVLLLLIVLGFFFFVCVPVSRASRLGRYRGSYFIAIIHVCLQLGSLFQSRDHPLTVYSSMTRKVQQ
jgi:hypothetical protein